MTMPTGAIAANARRSNGGGVQSPAPITARYDPGDLATLFQDSAGTVPVTASGQPVGRMLDTSGNGYHLVQASGTARPTYMESGGRRWLAFDGVDDWMEAVASYNMTAPLQHSIAIEIAAISGGNQNVFDGIGNRNAIYIPGGSTSINFYAGSAVPTMSDAGIGVGVPHVLTALFSGASSKLTIDTVAQSAMGNPGSSAHDRLRLGTYNGSVGMFGGRFYGMVSSDSVWSAAQQAAVETALGAACGLSL